LRFAPIGYFTHMTLHAGQRGPRILALGDMLRNFFAAELLKKMGASYAGQELAAGGAASEE